MSSSTSVFIRYIILIGKIVIVVCSIGYLILMFRMPKKPNIPPKLTNRFVVWTNDYHISPINDIKNQLASFDVAFIDKSLSGSCGSTNTCAKNLKVLNHSNGIDPNDFLRKEFYKVYRNDSEMNQVNIFMCFHPVAMCELFIPFNRTIIIIASTRYELGRHGPQAWNQLNENLQQIASNPKNVIGANNLYDAEYIRYFTGIRAIVLPSLCSYTKASYARQSHRPFLITRINKANFSHWFQTNLSNSLERLNQSVKVAHLRQVYKNHYAYRHLIRHPGLIYVPYQVSIMSLFEQYRMNIPLFFPSIDLLTEWHYKYHVVGERTWAGISDKYLNYSGIPGVLSSNIPDPNNELDYNAIRYWLQYADFYQWPHITYFHSIDDLAKKLIQTNLIQISEQMKIYNQKLTNDLNQQWKLILNRIH